MQSNSSISVNKRPSGIDVIGPVRWGTHFCQFYDSSDDLVETLVPYFKAGLESNEYCMWVTSEPLHAEQAEEALRRRMPDLDHYKSLGQIEILDYKDWYLPSGQFNADLVLQGWSQKLACACQNGFDGLRLTGNTFWLEAATWEDFTRYEEKINATIGEQNMIALCTYSLEKCGVHEILDVVANHQFALIKNAGQWEILESAEHKKMEEALRLSEARFQNLFESMTEGFALHEIILDDNGVPCDYRFLEINPSFERLTGLKRDDVVGHLVSEVLPDNDPYWVKIYGEVALTGKDVHFENYSSPLKQYYEVYAFSPAYRQFAVMFLNVTERKRMEENLRVNLTKYSVLFSSIPAGITVTDESGQIIESNKEAEKLLGITREEQQQRKIGGPEWLIIRPDGSPMPPEEFASVRALKEQHRVENIELGIVKKGQPGEGSVSWLNVSATPIPLPGYGVLVTYWDLSERKKMEEELRQAKDELELRVHERTAELALANQELKKALEVEKSLRSQLIAAEKHAALSRLLASVAHEINNPLQTVKNCFYMLHNDLPPIGKTRDLLEMGMSEANRIGELVQKLNEIYRPALKEGHQVMNLADLIKTVNGLLSAHLQQNHVIWQQENPPESIYVRGNADQFKQVIINICLNAVEAMQPQGGTIAVRIGEDQAKERAFIEFADTGPGISPENLPHIFEAFFTTKSKGTGLGLAISYEIIQNYGGAIHVKSEVNKGTTFTIWLPSAHMV